jgi:hypothetical protein
MMPANPGRYSLHTAYFTSLFCAIVGAIYGFKGVEPAPLAETFLQFAPILAVVLWLHLDMRSTRRMQIYDLGFLLGAVWPVLLPWHVFKTRGSRGWVLILKLFGLVLVPVIVRSIAQVYWMFR